jgi:hypothetical protein
VDLKKRAEKILCPFQSDHVAYAQKTFERERESFWDFIGVRILRRSPNIDSPVQGVKNQIQFG